MSLVPDDKVGKIQFYETRLDPWAARAAEIGTTPEQVAALADLTADARDAYNARYAAQQAAQMATQRLHAALDKMMTAGAAIVLQVRCKAAVDGDSIYPLASIPAPAKPSPIGEPGMPSRFSAELLADGSLVLKWKCKNPAGAVGTTYHVERAVGVTGPMVYIGTAGEKKFVDETIPPGTTSILYQVRAVRSTKVGPQATYLVNLCGSGRMVGGFVAKSRTARIAA